MISTLCIRADATSQIGSGHVMRALAIAQQWLATGRKVIFIGKIESPDLRSFLEEQGFNIEAQHGFHQGSLNDTANTLDACNRHRADWLLVDGYSFNPSYISTLKSAKTRTRIIQIDDSGLFPIYEADIIINPTAQATPALYEEKLGASSLILAGAQYTLLRSQVTRTARRSDNRSHPNELSIITFFGAAASSNITNLVLNALAESPLTERLSVLAVAGTMNPRVSEIESFSSSLSMRVKVIRDCPQFHEAAVKADLAIIAGGNTLQELAFLGVPTVLIAVADNQIHGCQYAHEHQYGIYAGTSDSIEPDRLACTLTSILEDVELRNKMSNNGKRQIDGKGAERIVNAMLRVSLK